MLVFIYVLIALGVFLASHQSVAEFTFVTRAGQLGIIKPNARIPLRIFFAAFWPVLVGGFLVGKE